MKDLVEAASETQPRTIGVLDLRFGGTSQLQNLYQEGASKALFARKQNGAEAICINTSGGITGGDRLTGHFETRDSAHLCVTTQGFERIYRSLNKTNGVIKNSITVRDKSSIYWLPQETLFYDGGYLDRSLVVNADSSASVLIVEPTLFGRIAMGEDKICGSLIDRITL
ncbi:MAG: urease accessory protein UreD, partial [Proteobacteria bacterium]